MRLLSNTLMGYVNGEIMKNTYDAYDAVIPIRHYSAKDIKEIRRRQGVSQGFLANWLGVSIKTVQAWESGANEPNGPSSRLLWLLEESKMQVDVFIDNA